LHSRKINMKSLITIVAGTLAFTATIATAWADGDVVDHSGKTSALSIRDQRAVAACADAFFSRIAPGIAPKTHIVVPPSSTAVMSHLQPDLALEVTMEARTAGQAVLARSTCRVNFDAKVTRLDTHVPNPTMLAGLTPKDIHLVLVASL
jgi:hypothetical protein